MPAETPQLIEHLFPEAAEKIAKPVTGGDTGGSRLHTRGGISKGACETVSELEWAFGFLV
jgi:hypothetical protein